MTTINKKLLLALAVSGAASLTACGTHGAAASAPASRVGMPNPAAVQCVDLGGQLALQDGLCRFDQAGIEEWTLWRATKGGERQQAAEAFLAGSTECGAAGGSYEAGEAGTTLCRFADRSLIEASTLTAGPSAWGYTRLAAVLGSGGSEADIQRQIGGDEGDRFMDALMAAGVQDTSGLLGATNIAAEKVSCSAAVVPHPVPRCRIDWNGVSLDASNADATALYDILVANGAVLTGTHVVGASNAVATQIKCTRVVYPGAKATCSFNVKPQH